MVATDAGERPALARSVVLDKDGTLDGGAAMTTDLPLVTRSDDRAWGAPVFTGTRVPVDTLFEYPETGETLEELLRQFPTVTGPCLHEGAARRDVAGRGLDLLPDHEATTVLQAGSRGSRTGSCFGWPS